MLKYTILIKLFVLNVLSEGGSTAPHCLDGDTIYTALDTHHSRNLAQTIL